MSTQVKPIRGDRSMMEVVRILVLLQGAILATAALESLVAIAFGGPALIPLVAVNALLAFVVLMSARGLRKGSRKARRTILVVEVLLMLLFVADSVIAVLITQAGLGLVPTLTRFLLPVSVIWTLNRAIVKPYFAKEIPAAPAPPAPPSLPAPPDEYAGLVVWTSA